MVEVGEDAPDFAIPNQNGEIKNLKNFEGKWSVIYFYPRDDTPGCTVEAKEFTDLNKQFEKLGCHIVGVSPDNEAKHCKFIDKYDLKIKQVGLNALAGFSFDLADTLKYKTLITQEMLSSGYLAGTNFYACTQHTAEHIETYIHYLDPVFKTIAECEAGRDINKVLKGPVSHAGFRRLN